MDSPATRLKRGFIANHKRMVTQLEPTSLLSSFLSEGLITLEEYQLLQKELIPSRMTDKLLVMLHRKGILDSKVYDKSLDIFREAGSLEGQYLEDLVSEILEASSDDATDSLRFDYTRSLVLEERHNAALRANEDIITASLRVEDVLPELVSSGVIAPEENSLVRGEPLDSLKAKRLISILYQRGSRGFSKFVEALLNSEGQEQLGRLLMDEEGVGPEVEDEERFVSEVLKRGHVPPRQPVYVERAETIAKIRNELRKLKDTDGWLVLHGMAGFGKTILAAEAVRDARLLREVFHPGGVHWLTVGQLTNARGELDKANLLTKIQNLIVRLDKGGHRPPNLEAATDYLQKVISEQHPYSLLILDDVWSPEVAEVFSVRCRTMVTTRNALVASSVQSPNIYSVSVSDGFSDEEGKILLAQWVKRTVSELPGEAETIIKYCRGSPMAIALIGAILRKNPKVARWKAITQKLMESYSHISALHVTPRVNEWNYQHPTLNASIQLSEESLSDGLLELFQSLVVFDYDTLVPSPALETIWGQDIFEVEDNMAELVGQSLAQNANPGKERQDDSCLLYTIHDIIVDYLRDKLPQEKQRQLHNMVVERYRLKSEGDFSSLEDDDYVYQKLLYHVGRAGRFDLLGELLSGLRWIVSSVQHANANTLLAYYKDLAEEVPELWKDEVTQFRLFVSGHMDVLAEHPRREEVVQLALLLPDSSEVFKQARTMAASDRKRSWFTWSNKVSEAEKYALKLRLHRSGVKHCCYSRDGSEVLSCSEDGDVKLWDAATGIVRSEFKGHKDIVNCCDLSSSGKLVLSCSEDYTVKVWAARKKTLLLSFKHKSGVQCCAFSPDETLVLSADIDTHIYLWETKTGKVRSRWLHGVPLSPVTPEGKESENERPFLVPVRSPSGGWGVMCCAFAPDGKQVVTAAQAGSVRLWDLEGNAMHSFDGHHAEVKSVSFSRDSKLLLTSSLDETARVWDVPSGKCLKTFKQSCQILSAALSPDASRLITGDVHGSVKVWFVERALLLQELPVHNDFVNCVRYSPNGRNILSAADDGIVKILSAEADTVEPAPSRASYRRRFWSTFVREEDAYHPLVLCFDDREGKLKVLYRKDAAVVVPAAPTLPSAAVRTWVVSEDSTRVLVGYCRGQIQMLSLERCTDVRRAGEWNMGEVWSVSQAHEGKVLKCYFSADVSMVVTCGDDRKHKTWSAKEGHPLASVDGWDIGVRLCVFFQDSIRLASAHERNITIWSGRTGETKRTLEGIVQSNKHSILSINLSQDDSRLVASATSGLVMVWSTVNGAQLFQSKVTAFMECARSSALSPDGTLAAAGYDDGSLRIFNISTGVEVHQRNSSSYWMVDVAFSPDGREIVTLCDSIQWWGTDGSHLKTVLLKGTFGKFVQFSPDFKTFVTIDNAGRLYLLSSLQVD